ncbi:hypothetical protein GCM10023194_50730 [Planotetraspora phitsanulokensis]|uniref:Uncharacterized protein n=2 Tax=Planotetraspora TaxID=58120 RepID=A0A8J3UJI5_9ACTN|nr:hypothetical protein [Planotetraspora phitsanulokensis]GIG81159.1 hypothetical protein Pka01_42860 [Planotetraspora kaengkrachanensis]GII39945.1 hypothetical protein Pph01_49480 [Planotetraspora phitsanulokensis]
MGVVTAVQAKKVIKWGAIGMAAFYLLSKPADAAQTVHGAYNGLVSAGNSMAQFFAQLT